MVTYFDQYYLFNIGTFLVRFISALITTALVRKAGTIFALAFLSILVIGTVSPAWAAQLNWDAKTFDSAAKPSFKFQRTIFIEYPQGGDIANTLNGKSNSIYFTADSSTPGVKAIIDKINEQLQSKQSTVRVTELQIEYTAEMTGRSDNTSVDYKLVITPTIDGFLIREYMPAAGSSPAIPALFDAMWRGIKVDGAFPLTTENYGDMDINQPISFFKKEFPDVAAKMAGSEAENVLSMPLIDASDIGKQPLGNWHFLFDPTGIAAETSKFGFSGARIVVSSFTMGESSFREGQQREKEFIGTFTADKSYNVRSVQSADNANVFLAGYASPAMFENREVFGVSATAPTGAAQTSTGSFPIFIMYGMAGMAAVGAVGFFIWSNKKAKKESEYIQTGIDPKYLRGVTTSEASGGYHTNRGEAELASDDTGHQQHESVYEKKGSLPKGYEQPKEEPKSSSSRGSMPKDWKPSD